MSVDLPITINISRERLVQLSEEECGSWEDYGRPEPGTIPILDGESYGCEHPYNVLRRWPFKIESQAELDNLLDNVLENSIDKARGWVVESYAFREGGTAEYRSWLRWLERLRDRLEAFRERSDA